MSFCLCQSVSAQQVHDCSGAGRYHSSAPSALLMLNLQGCSHRGRLFCTRGNCRSKKIPHTFYYTLLHWLWEFLLEWVVMRVVLSEAAKDFPSLTSVPPTHHTTSSSYKVGLLIPTPHCFACPVTSPEQRGGQMLKKMLCEALELNPGTQMTAFHTVKCSHCAQGFPVC